MKSIVYGQYGYRAEAHSVGLTLSLPKMQIATYCTDFTLSNARRFYSSMWEPLAVKGLKY